MGLKALEDIPPHVRLVRTGRQTVANHSDATDHVVLGITCIT